MQEPELSAAAARAVFFPRPDLPYGPDHPGAWEHRFEVEPGVAQRIRVFPAPAPGAADVLFFHGNGETARDYDPLAPAFHDVGATLWAAEYRGYGLAGGQPTMDAALADAHRALDEVLAQRAAQSTSGPLVVMGRSLGSAPAIELAAHRAGDLHGLVVESGFARVVPLLELCGLPAARLGLTEAWGPRNLDKMGRVALPVLILHADNDEIIPIADAELLHGAAQDPDKAFLRVAGAGHNDIQMRAGPAYFSYLAALLERARHPPGRDPTAAARRPPGGGLQGPGR